MNFNSVDLADYGLTALLSSPIPWMPPLKHGDTGAHWRTYQSYTELLPREITLDCIVTAADRATLISYLDSLSLLLSPTNDEKKLQLDFPTGRYWNAKVSQGVLWEPVSQDTAMGSISFICSDPRAYDDDQTSSPFDIDADPDTVVETTGSTASIEPVYTLTAGENLVAVTIKLANVTTDEELQWTGSLANGEVLEIDVPNWIVNKEGAASMATVTGQFPRLAPGAANTLTVTGFSTTGTLNITYRNRFL